MIAFAGLAGEGEQQVALLALGDPIGVKEPARALSDRWGCERTGYRRKVVWAELAL